MKNKKLLRLVLTALFMAMICVATLVIQIPLPAHGYLNAGDAIVLLGAWLLGPLYGSIAAGVGSALADLITGYSLFAPGTLVIKALCAFTAAMIFRATGKKLAGKRHPIAFRILSGVIAEIIMVLGYFGYSALLLRQGLAAAADAAGNFVQGFFGVALGTLLCELLLSNHQIKTFMERMH